MEACASRISVKESLITRRTKRQALLAFPEIEKLSHDGMGRSRGDEKDSDGDDNE